MKDIYPIVINFCNTENSKLVTLWKQRIIADRKFNDNQIKETFYVVLTKEELKDLAKKLLAAAGV